MRAKERLLRGPLRDFDAYWSEAADFSQTWVTLDEKDLVYGPFWKPEFCELLIKAAEEHGAFGPLPTDVVNDTAPGMELRITEFLPELQPFYVEHILRIWKPRLEEFFHWHFLYGPEVFRVPFMLRYLMNEQRSMSEHHDSSLLSLSVKLNDDYEGCHLEFPRQNWKNSDMPVGWILFFPGMLTHPHFVSELTSGKRYSLTGWVRGMDLSAPNLL